LRLTRQGPPETRSPVGPAATPTRQDDPFAICAAKATIAPVPALHRADPLWTEGRAAIPGLIGVLVAGMGTMVAFAARDRRMRPGMSATRSRRMAASAVSSATSVPDPIATPTEACRSAGTFFDQSA
jgi:hypothetical protein